MIKFVKVNGFKQKHNQGGILLTAILFLLFFTSLFLVLVEDYQITKSYYLNSKNQYTARIMKEMFLNEYYQKDGLTENPIEFSTGTLTYTEKERLEIDVRLGTQHFSFSEDLREVQK